MAQEKTIQEKTIITKSQLNDYVFGADVKMVVKKLIFGISPDYPTVAKMKEYYAGGRDAEGKLLPIPQDVLDKHTFILTFHYEGTTVGLSVDKHGTQTTHEKQWYNSARLGEVHGVAKWKEEDILDLESRNLDINVSELYTERSRKPAKEVTADDAILAMKKKGMSNDEIIARLMEKANALKA